MATFKVKKLRANSVIPTKAHDNDTGYDLYASEINLNFLKNQITVKTGIAVQPEPGYYCELYPRSSVCKHKLQLANSVGIVDESYTGELIMVFDFIGDGVLVDILNIGDRVGQLVVRKRETAEFEEVTELDTTKRGDGGFGSTGAN